MVPVFEGRFSKSRSSGNSRVRTTMPRILLVETSVAVLFIGALRDF